MEPSVKRRKKLTNLTLSKKSKNYLRKRSLNNSTFNDSLGDKENTPNYYPQRTIKPLPCDSPSVITGFAPKLKETRAIGTQSENFMQNKGTQWKSTTIERDTQHHVIEAIMPTFLEKMSQFKLLDKFITFLTVVADDLLEPTNIALLCLLDRAQYAACKSTTTMSYHPETLQFWTSIYLLFGNSALNIFRGPGNTGQVISEEARRGMYDPRKARTNFAVPSVPTVRKVDMGYSKNLQPGLIPHTLDVAENMSQQGSQFVLSMDGKKCSHGLGSEPFAGDIYLLGAEKPNLIQTMRLHEHDLKVLKNVPMKLLPSNRESQWFRLHQMLNINSRRIKRMRMETENLCTQRKRMIQLARNNPDNEKRYKFGLSRLNASTVSLQNVIKRTLLLNDECTVLIQKLFSSYCGLKPIPSEFPVCTITTACFQLNMFPFSLTWMWKLSTLSQKAANGSN